MKSRPLRDDPARAAHTAEVLKAVAHPLRLRIIALLCEAEHNVNELADSLDVPQPIVSQQLRILRMRHLVDCTRQGGHSRYYLVEQHLKTLVSCMEKVR